MLRRIFHCVKVETNSNYLKRSMLKHTNRYCHKPTQNNITRTHTDTQQPKIMSHQSKIISFEKKISGKLWTKDWPWKSQMTETTQKCYLTLYVPHVEYTRPAKTMFKGSHHKQNLPNTVWVPGSGRQRQALGATGTKIVYLHRYLWHFLWWESLDIVESKG